MNWYKKYAQAKEQIAAAAIKHDRGPTADNTVYALPQPARHHNVIRDMREKGVPKPIVGTQGFVTNTGRFVDRIEGAKIAIEAGQIQKLNWPPNLYSEDLW